ncbi:MAG: transketolase [Lewinellaceae bacterium]|nr:transketolase [Lewinellaceae bacterium]
MIETTSASPSKKKNNKHQSEGFNPEEVLQDYRICCLSREASILARKEVLMGRANFGIIGDGKEVAQVAMAKAWKKGDFRSGYYRDQTLMMALGLMSLEEFFAQLYGDPASDTMSGGRQMNCHFATPLIHPDGTWVDQKNQFNISTDISSTGGQMARALGLAFASKKYRELPAINGEMSNKGNEVTFCTIGDASTSEGVFWETVNAAGVLQVPLAISVWDDGYGISVPQKYQTSKESISEVLRGFDGKGGVNIRTGKGWDYPGLVKLFTENIGEMRETHQPVLFHIQEVTQQLGHSTSGDHRRYKSPERLAFEEEYDCNKRMAIWMVDTGIATEEQIASIQKEAKKEVQAAAKRVYEQYHNDVDHQLARLLALVEQAVGQLPNDEHLRNLASEIQSRRDPLRFEVLKYARKAYFLLSGRDAGIQSELKDIIDQASQQNEDWYSKYLYSETPNSALKVQVVPPQFSKDSPIKDAFDVLNACFDANFEKYPKLFAFGEDVGHIGDVNQGLRGMQEKYGIERVFDVGIREWTIMGQAIGMSMRGLRPIAEIQYLDYLLYGLTALSDDLSTVRWRSNNLQAAPAIIRTRGHRLVGVWHSGSPMSMMLGSLRGMLICVPRNMTQAAGMYNTLLQSDDPAIVVEVLNGYRLKERLPDNIGTFTVPMGVPELLKEGNDLTIITYGASVRIAEEALDMLAVHGIHADLIDVQTLMPFDLPQMCLRSIQKTNRVLFLDEDVPGGASAFMMQQVLELQGAYQHLDSAPITLAAKAHRPAYGQDGDYASKPQAEDVFEAVYNMMREADPGRLPVQL